MKQFFGAFLGSILGLLITGIIIALIIAASIAGLVSKAKTIGNDALVDVSENSVLRLNLNGEINERGTKSPFGNLKFGPIKPSTSIGINDVIASLTKAKIDNNIKGIYLEISNPIAGFASLEEVRNALLDFKKSGKFVIAYAEVYTQKAYYLASVANKCYLNPQGGFEVKGLSSQVMFYKNMLEKLNVEVQIFRHGKFKSAIEPFMLDKMSEANRAQIETYLGSLWQQMVVGVSKDRKISIDEINTIANNLLVRNPNDAVKYHFIDELKYEDEVFALIKKTMNVNDNQKLNFVTLTDYATTVDQINNSKNKIAVIYAVGEIVSGDGDGDDDKMGSEKIVNALRKARLDDDVKAIVLRVNSPGGSALASDVMWRETLLAKQAKPLIVSMGDVAASGGYYISCMGDRIFAQPNTITGSIGVFGMIPNAQKALADKLGITIDTVNTNKHSDVGTILRGVTKDEYAYVQQSVEHIYDVFITKVAQGRKTTKNLIDSVGQGRVWSGADAIKINLVDELGGIKDAVNYAAKMAKLSNYKLVDYPKQADALEELLGNTKEEMETRYLKTNFISLYPYLKQVKCALQLKGVQARLPYEMIIE